MFEEKKQTLILVCTDETMQYGNYLLQLIGLNDDRDGEIVGLRDDSVDAVLWTEKDYAANRPTLSSSQKIVFLGSSKNMKQERKNMDDVFAKYGMYFSALGNRASAYVDGSMSKKEYTNFLEFAHQYKDTYENMMKKYSLIAQKTKTLAWLLIGGVYGGGGKLIWDWFKRRKEINEQRYSFLMLYIYLECLKKFVEG